MKVKGWTRRGFLGSTARWTAAGIVAPQIVPARAAEKSTPPSSPLLLSNTVDEKTTFRIFRRLPKNNYWDDGSPYSRTDALELIKALDASKRWDSKSHAIAYGMLHAHSPGIEIEIDWSRTKEEQKTHSIALCYGN